MNYEKTIWQKGDKITPEKLNKIEDAIEQLSSNEIHNKANSDLLEKHKIKGGKQ